MAGLINKVQTQRFHNQTLGQIASQIEVKIPPAGKAQFLAIENSGMQIMFSTETKHLIKKYVDPNNLVPSISNSIAMLLAFIYKQSNKKMNITMATPAGIVLMAHALDYEESVGDITLNPQVIAQCVHETTTACLKAFGIGPQQINQAVAQGKAAQAKQGVQA